MPNPLYRKKQMVELLSVLPNKDVLVQNQGDSSDQWVIPAATFETTYEAVDSDGLTPVVPDATFGFDSALKALKRGAMVARQGWNGKGMHVEILNGVVIESLVNVEPFFIIKNVRGTYNTWVPSVADLLAEDWLVIL